MSDHWFQQFAGRFGFPDNYTTVDIETNGVNPEEQFICSIGHTVVRDRRAVETVEAYLNWPGHPDVDQVQFQQDLERTERALRAQNKPFHHTFSRLRIEGRPPIKVLEDYLALFEDMEQRREILVAHNGWRFDMEFLQAHFHNWLRIPFYFDTELVYDTGICEKASQLQDFDDPLPLAGESMQQFSWRIGELRRRGIYWALDRYCNEKYGLFEKAGADPSMAHTAGQDSRVLHYLFEEHRALADMARDIGLSTDGPQGIQTADG